MYAEVVAWRFTPGTHAAVRQTALQILLPAVQRQPGFRCWYLVRSGANAFLTIALFATREQAERSHEELTPLFRIHQGHLVESMERHAGEVEIQAGVSAEAVSR